MTTIAIAAPNDWLLLSSRHLSYHPVFLFSAPSPFFSGEYSISAKVSIQDGFKTPTSQFVYLGTCQDHEGSYPWLVYMDVHDLQHQEGQDSSSKSGLVPDSRSPSDGSFSWPTSSWPSASFIHGWYHLLWIQILRVLTLGYLRPRHRAWISFIVMQDSGQCVVPESLGLSDRADLGVNYGSTVCLLGGWVIYWIALHFKFLTC